MRVQGVYMENWLKTGSVIAIPMLSFNGVVFIDILGFFALSNG